MPYWCTKFERNRSRRRFFWLKVVVLNQCEEEKCEENRAIFRNIAISCKLLSRFSSNLVCKVMYMKGIKFMTLIETGPVGSDYRYERLKMVT